MQPGGVSSLPNSAELGGFGAEKAESEPGSSPSAPALGELGRAGHHLWAGTSWELSLRQEFCAVPFTHVPVPPHSSSTPRAEASSDSAQKHKGKVRVCRVCAQGPTGQGRSIPSRDSHSQARMSLVLLVCSIASPG